MDRLLEAWRPWDGSILEPGAGDGSIIRAAAATLGPRVWHAVELRDAAAPALQTTLSDDYVGATPSTYVISDFLEGEVPAWWSCCSAAIGNPPYSLAEQFVRRTREVAPAADICFLLRLNFLGSDGRCEWLRADAPDVYVLPDRPVFRLGWNKKKRRWQPQTDSCEYGWLVWPHVAQPYGRVRVLKTTPLEVRRAQFPKLPDVHVPPAGLEEPEVAT